MDEKDMVREKLLEDVAYFSNAINLIPTHFYFDAESKQKLKDENSDDDEEGHDASPKRGEKRAGDSLSHKAKWKRKQFDPNQHRSVTELQELIMEVDERETSEAGSGSKVTKQKGKSHNNDTTPADLKHRLHNKLEELRAKRKADPFEKRKQKKRDKKAKLLRRKAAKQNMSKGENSLSNGLKSGGKLKSPAKKPIYNKDGNMVFSKFDFKASGSSRDAKSAGAPTGKNYKVLLEKAEKEKEKINKLKETDKTKAKEYTEKKQWMTALQKAEGVKIKDNPELLKKALKKKEKMKDKRKKGWVDREQKVKNRMKEQQDKRSGNIKKRKQQNLDSKIKKAKKKGRIIPGF